MEIVIRKYEEKDLCVMIEIWNEIVEEGNAFPQEEFLTLESGADFFAEQTYTGVAVDSETEKPCLRPCLIQSNTSFSPICNPLL